MSENINKVEQDRLLKVLKERFEKHVKRHQTVSWDDILSHLSEDHIYSIYHMELTGGQPDAVCFENNLFFVDMAKETPKDRRSICYDKKARLGRKKFPPKTSVLEMAEEMKIEVLDKDMYMKLQEIEDIDLKTSSWIKTPENIRKLGGALYGDKRYNETFIYHNGADSYYGVRGFRGYIKIY
ncbi:DUF4256 domain-containing protein [Mariniplasma anaerobium]|uniref:DUF4256 domain-containing protein n=1 Tax=Mariniplasma anaerobium TaxID=2735436 RepID=A0A7U9TH12_9MOLU|nr:DUF4256 domain-containing protein [Mariniplasma anaerobium]BCR36257.1 hypothetical protein MPAN_011500 [Mariniplasma anaerobium]